MTLWIALARIAAADIVSPGYVEDCTTARCPAGAEARECQASFEGREACEALEKEGFVAACKTRGASVWTEVMCKAAAPVPPAPPAAPAPPPAEEARCATTPAVAGLAALLVASTLTRRRS